MTSDFKQTRFIEAVTLSFGFLRELGFSENPANANSVQYQNGKVLVVIYREPYSYEIGADISLGSTKYSIGEVMGAIDPQIAKRYRDWASATDAGMAFGVQTLADLIKRYGSIALTGDPGFFAMLAEKRTARAERFALGISKEG